MLVINGEGYDALIGAYGRGDISSKSEIIVEFEKTWFDRYSPDSNSIVFNEKGILCFVKHDKTSLIGRTLRLEDLARIGSWGAMTSPERSKEYEEKSQKNYKRVVVKA